MKTLRPHRIAVITLAVFTLSLFTLFYRSDNALTKSGNAAVAPTLSATKTGALDTTAGGDLSGSGVVNPGDRLNYSVVVNNAGTAATGVDFSDTIDPNTTFVSGSLIASPVAVNESYSAVGNVSISVPAAAGVLANDQNPNSGAACSVGNTCTITTAGSFLSANGGNVILNADGGFTFNPKTGFEGTDTFSYTLSNGTGMTDGATVTINVSGMIWFVNNNAGACSANCDGRLSNPFTTLAAFHAANTLNPGGGFNPDNNDNIFVYESATSYAGALTLRGGQKLIGQDASATLNAIAGFTIPAFSAALPATNSGNPSLVTITSSANGINLASGNTLRGLTIGNTTGAKLNATAAVGALTIGAAGAADVTLNGSGQAINLTGGGTLAANFASISSTGGATGITLTGMGGNLATASTAITTPTGIGINVASSVAGGTFNFGNTTVANSAGAGVVLGGASAGNANSITFAALNVTPAANQRALLAQNNTGTITTASGTIAASGATAIEITQSSGTTPLNVQLTSVSANGGSNGIVLTNTSSSGSPGGFSVIGGGVSDASNTTRGRITAKSGGGTITLGSGGTITATSGKAVQLNNSASVVLRNMNVQNNGSASAGSGDDGINATTVSGLTLDNVLVTGHAGNFGLRGRSVSNLSIVHSEIHNNATTSGVEGSDIWNVRFNDLTGSCSLQHSKFATAREFAFGIYQNGTSTLNLSVSNSEFTDAVSGLSISAFNNSNVSFNVTGSSFLRDTSNGIFYGGNESSGGGTLTVQDSTFEQNTVDINIAHQGAGKTQKFNVTNNTIKQTFKTGSSNSINVYLGGTSTAGSVFEGVISNNRIGNAGAANSGSDLGRGIFVESAGAGTLTASVTGNTVRQIKQESAFYGQVAKGTSTAASSPRLNLTIIGNDFQVNTASANALAGIELTAGTIPNIGDNPTLCANINGNAASVGHPTFAGVYVVTAGFTGNGTSANPTVELQGYTGAANNLAQIEAFLSSSARATINTTAAILAQTTGTVRAATAPCATPALSFAQLNPNVEIDDSQASFTDFSSNAADLTAKTGDVLQKERLTGELTNAPNSGTASASKFDVFADVVQGVKEYAFSALNYAWTATRTISSAVTPTTSAKEITSVSNAPLSGETITKSLGTIPAGEIVTIQFKVTIDANIPSNDFSVSNTANITADGGININSTTATTTVVQPASIAKAFGASHIAVNETTTLTFTLANGNASPLTNVSFSDPLPAGLIVADTPGVVNNCSNGTATAAAGASAISYSGGTRAASTSCRIVVNVKGTTEGAKNNVTDAVASIEGGTGNTASATLNVITPPSFTKAFGASTIQLNGTTTLTFTINNNSAAFPLNNVGFTDNLPAGLVVAAAPSVTGSCGGGTVTANAGASSIGLSGAVMGTSSVCVVGVNVTGTTAGVKNNSVALSTAELGTGATATASITVVAPPTIAKAFASSPIQSGGNSIVTLTLSNGNTTEALTNASFTDALTNMTAVGGAASGTCAGASSNVLSAGATALNFSGITIPNNESCTVTFAVTSSAAGTHPNTTSGVTTTQTTTAGTPSNTANLTVIAPPQIAKTFLPDSINVNDISILGINITNPSGNTVNLTNVSVTDAFPAGMEVAAAPDATNSCSTGSTFAPAAGATNISISNVTIPVNTTCAFTVKVKGTTAGEKINTTGNVTSANGGTGATASAILTVNAPTFSVSGTVSYGNTPTGEAAKFVPGVTLTAAGTPQVIAATDASGAYSLGGLGTGNYTVTPTKSGDVNGIGSLDATRIQQHLVGLTALTPNQLIAADVDGNGAVNSLDATRIQQHLVMIPAPNIIGQWRFAPINRQYNPVSGNATGEDYQAILVGDVTGNWTAPGQLAENSQAENSQAAEESTAVGRTNRDGGKTEKNKTEDSVESNESATSESAVAGASVSVSLPTNATASTSTIVTIPVSISALPTGVGIESFDFSVFFDPNVLQPASPVGGNAGTLSAQCSVLSNSPSAGRVIVSGACGNPPITAGSGVLFNLRFNVIGAANQTTALSFTNPANNTDSFQFNNGNPAATTIDGQFTVLGTTAVSVSVSGRVTNAHGRGIGNVTVTMTDANGNQQTAQTTSFGYYRFETVAAGETVTLTAKAKRFRFVQPTIVRTTNESVSDADFIGER